jgi:hypothetical protein
VNTVTFGFHKRTKTFDKLSLYINKRMEIGKGTSVSNKEVHINQGIKQGCPMSPTLFNIFIDEVIRQ